MVVASLIDAGADVNVLMEALKSLNESLREEDYMNLSADITTLQSLLKKDSLVSEPFKEKGDNND